MSAESSPSARPIGQRTVGWLAPSASGGRPSDGLPNMAPRPMRRAALARHNDSMDIDPELAGDTSLTLDGTAMAREDSSDMDEGSGDDYADPRAGPSNSQQAEEAPGEDDAVFQ